MKPPRVRLVVLNYNGGRLLERCVEHLEALDWPDDRLELVVVDNASRDGSDDAIEQHHPRVKIVRSGTNLGFPANNLALRDLDGIDYVGLVNNDAFVESSWLKELVGALEADASLGAVCPKILLAPRFIDVEILGAPMDVRHDPRELSAKLSGVRAELGSADLLARTGEGPGCYGPERGPWEEPSFRWLAPKAVLQYPLEGGVVPATISLRLARPSPGTLEVRVGGLSTTVQVGSWPTWHDISLEGAVVEPYDLINNAGSILIEGGHGADRGFLDRDVGQYDHQEDVFAWCGAGVLFRRAYLQDVGLFEEWFFMYYEDTDLSWRGRARGWRYRYVPTAEMRHVHAATSVVGSPMFRHYVERNRLAMLLRNAPASVVWGAFYEFVKATVSYFASDAVRPMLRGRRPSLVNVRFRVRSLLGVVKSAPQLLRQRRALRQAQSVPDDALLAWIVPS